MALVTSFKSDGSSSTVDVPVESPTDCSSVSSVLTFTMDFEDSSSTDTDEEIANKATVGLKVKSEPCTPTEAVAGISKQQQHTPEASESPSPPAAEPPKKRRGRPRKNPIVVGPAKSPRGHQHARSKTGCITCRLRKKKCDERKPECDNCFKNNIQCQGYYPKTFWQGGKIKNAKQKQLLSRRLPIPEMPPRPFHVYQGIETEVDYVLYQHFHQKLSRILTINTTEQNNPFIQMVLPMAMEHVGLMHSILGLSAAHLMRIEPKQEFEQRKEYHCNDAISIMAKDVTDAMSRNADVEDPIVACMILQCLIPVSNGSVKGEHRPHLEAARKYIKFRPKEEFGKFAWEFYRYYDMSDAITSLNRMPEYIGGDDGNALLPDPSGLSIFEETVMVGVLDGLYPFIMQINYIRDMIRRTRNEGRSPPVEYCVMYQAAEISTCLTDWESNLEEWTSRWVIAELYREAMLVYLHRSIRASKPDEDLSKRVNRGLIYLEMLIKERVTQCTLLPTFILGCAAFGQEQRDKTAEILDKLEEYSRQGNIAPTRRVVQMVWRMMDVGDMRCWDWETIMKGMSIDISVT